MKKKNNKHTFPIVSAALIGASALLLIGSTVGSTRAALTYYSENYGARIQVSRIGVTLKENGNAISSRDYTEDSRWSETKGTLLEGLLEEGETIQPGKAYDETLSVSNSGSIDSFVRVVLKKSWVNPEGEKDTTLSPDLIDLNLTEGSGWVIDESASTAERTVLYYTRALAPGKSTPALSDTLRIDPAVMTKVTETVTEDENGYKTIETSYDYDGYQFRIEAEADAVQTHNAEDAIKSAWGVDVTASEDGTGISLE